METIVNPFALQDRWEYATCVAPKPVLRKSGRKPQATSGTKCKREVLMKIIRIGVSGWAFLGAALAVVASLCAGCGQANSGKPASPTTNQTSQSVPAEATMLSESDVDLLQSAAEKAGDKSPAAEETRAWREIVKGLETLQSPAVPPEWQTQEPSKEEMAAFQKQQGDLAARIADQAKAFYTKFPNHEKAPDARKVEFDLINLTVQMGNTNRAEQLHAMEQALLKDA